MSELSTQLTNVASLWEGFEDVKPHLEKMRRDIFSPLAQELGWDVKQGELELDKLLRVLVLSEAGLAGDNNVISEAKNRYEQFINGNYDIVSPDLRNTVYKIVLKQSDDKEEEKVWKEIFNIYNDESFPMDQRVVALQSLGSTIKTKAMIEKTMALVLNEQEVRTQDASVFFRS